MNEISKSRAALARRKIKTLHWCPLRRVWRAFSCTNAFVRFAVIRRSRFVSFSAVITFLTASATPTTVPADIGIAARYPGDKNIASDPAVILADDFESYTSPSQLTTKWTGAYQMANLRIATEAGNYYAGDKALEMKLPISTTEISNSLKKILNPTQDVVFIRTYQKWDAAYSYLTSNHNGMRLSAKYPGPGIAPPVDGTGFFLFLLQNNIEGSAMAGESAPGFAHFYSYWPKQRSAYGDHWYPTGLVKPGGNGEWLTTPAQYPNFKVMPNFLPQRDRWYCYEMMVKANTPGTNNGEVKAWVDGNVIADFPNLNMRSIATLKIDEAHIALQAAHSEKVNKKWYDNVVIATQYIGPMASPSPSPSPTNANANTDTNTNTNPYANANTNTNTNSNTDSNSNADTNANTNSISRCNASTKSYTNSHAYSDSHANPDSNRNAVT